MSQLSPRLKIVFLKGQALAGQVAMTDNLASVNAKGEIRVYNSVTRSYTAEHRLTPEQQATVRAAVANSTVHIFDSDMPPAAK